MAIGRFAHLALSLVALAGPLSALAQTCPSNAPLFCGYDRCCPYGDYGRTDVCCNENPPEQGCTSNGDCTIGGTTTTGGGGGTAIECAPGQIATQDTCAETTCSCADSCSSGGDCVSGCCANGYCALS